MSFLSTLNVDYGRQFLWTLGIAYFGLRGLTGAGVYALALPYYQELVNADLETYHRTLLYVSFPWAAKPLIGFLSDHVPLLGYRKRNYIVVAAALAFIGCTSLAIVPPAVSNVWFFFFIVLGIVVSDLLLEAKYSELMSQTRANVSGANIISYAWGLASVGGALGALWGAQMAHNNLIKDAFYLLAIPPFYFGLNVYVNGVQESKKEKFTPLKLPLVVVAAWLTGSTLISAVTIYSLTPVTAVVIQLLCAASLIYASLRWIPKLKGAQTTLARCNVFLFVAEISSVRLTGATDYFFTADCPTGSGSTGKYPTPNFSYDFYLGWTPIVASVAGLGGVFIFSRYLQHLPLRYVFQGVGVVRILLTGVEVWQASRKNLGYIDDTLLFFLSEGIIGPVVSMTYLLPLVAITSRMMPKGHEALTYGILAGYQNFGQVIANSIGLMLIEITNVGHNCDFVDYPFVVFCGHILAPLLTIPLASFLVPLMPISAESSPKSVVPAPGALVTNHAIDAGLLPPLRGLSPLEE